MGTTDLACRLEVRSVYGEWKIYPFGPVAEGFARIAGTKTLTGGALREIERLGYRLEVVNGLLIDTDALLARTMGRREAA